MDGKTLFGLIVMRPWDNVTMMDIHWDSCVFACQFRAPDVTVQVLEKSLGAYCANSCMSSKFIMKTTKFIFKLSCFHTNLITYIYKRWKEFVLVRITRTPDLIFHASFTNQAKVLMMLHYHRQPMFSMFTVNKYLLMRLGPHQTQFHKALLWVHTSSLIELLTILCSLT